MIKTKKTGKNQNFIRLFPIFIGIILFLVSSCATPASNSKTNIAVIEPGIVADPVFLPAPGAYTGPQSVTITSTTIDANIYYTVDGSDPTTDSIPYTAAITVNSYKDIRAIAVKSGMSDSSIKRAEYEISSIAFLSKKTFDPSQDTSPTALFIKSDNSLFISLKVPNNDRAEEYSPAGFLRRQFGTSGTGNGEFNYPKGICVNSGNSIYVIDSGNSRIQRFNSTGSYSIKFGSAGSGNGQFNFGGASSLITVGMIIDDLAIIYVADPYNHRVQKIDANGVFRSSFGNASTGNGANDFVPVDIAFDSNDNIYVLDASNDVVLKYDPINDPDLENPVIIINKTANELTSLSSPRAITLDSSDNIYVCCLTGAMFKKYDPNGVFLLKFGTYGSNDGQYLYPTDIEIDTTGKIYVSDYNRHDVQIFQQ